jgi:hypothetical protein
VTTFTPEDLRGFALLCDLLPEALDLLAARLNKLDHYTPPVGAAGYDKAGQPLSIVEREVDQTFLYRLRFDSHPEYGRTNGHPPIAIEKPQHRWHGFARGIDDALREIPGLELGYPSDGRGPTMDFIFWALKKIRSGSIPDQHMITPAAVAQELRRRQKPQHNRPGQT